MAQHYQQHYNTAPNEVQFKILSKHAYKPHLDSVVPHCAQEEEKDYLHLMNEESDIFNDALGDGGVEPSLDESIRDSIRCSFVSSEAGDLCSENDSSRDLFVMSRINWINSLQLIFNELETFNQHKQKHVENANFLKALKKVKSLLPLKSRNEYYKVSSDVAFTYKEVELVVSKLPRYITLDNVVDAFLTKPSTQATNPSILQSQGVKQRESTLENYYQPMQQEESYLSEVNAVEDMSDMSYQYRNKGGKMQSILAPSNDKRNSKEIFVMSFAEGVMMMAGGPNQLGSLDSHQFLAQAPLLLKDDDEACEVDGDSEMDCDSNAGGDESKSNRRARNKLEESVRSSRTATFKSIRNASVHNNTQGLVNITQSSINHNTPAQDSYYAVQQNTAHKQPAHKQITNYYHQAQHSLSNRVDLKMNESAESQVESQSQHSRTSSTRYKNVQESLFTYDEPQAIDKSTRISSQNSGQKNHNNTILSQGSSHSSSSYQARNQNFGSKVSVLSSGQTSASGLNQSNFVDLDHQRKGFTNFEMDFKMAYGDKKVLRSINLSQNGLIKLPSTFEKSLQYLNISFNKLKSLHGIECCVNLKLLNVQGNFLTSAQPIVILQSMRELIISNNQLSFVKDVAQLKNLNMLDLSNNKLIDFEKIIPLQNLKKLNILSLFGNMIQKATTYEQTVKKLMPWVQVLDPDSIKDFTQFSSMENICFTDQPLVIHEQSSQLNLVKREVFTVEKEKERSKTPNKERAKSTLGNFDPKLKSTAISPHRRQTMEQQPSARNQQLKQQLDYQLKAYQEQYSDNKFRMQGKAQAVVKGNVTSRNQDKSRSFLTESRLGQDKSQLREKSNTQRERSTSNISRNNQVKPFSSVQSSTKASLQMSKEKPKESDTRVKESAIKKISVNVNVAKSCLSQGKMTPKNGSAQTPRQEKPTHYYKRSFCQTEEEPSISLDTPSERNTIRTAPTQESSNKKPTKLVSRKEDLGLILSPGQKKEMYSTMAPTLSSRNNVRPATTMKQRANTSQTNDKDSQPINQTMQHLPQSTKNSNHSQSFAFEHPRTQPGSRPSSQLQKFITASKVKGSVQPPTISQPCQKLTNLPPRAYQSRVEKPGDKKSKADMSSSLMSSQVKMSVMVSEEEEERQSSGSMSPVGDESSNIKKLQVDLTQYMNKQL